MSARPTPTWSFGLANAGGLTARASIPAATSASANLRPIRGAAAMRPQSMRRRRRACRFGASLGFVLHVGVELDLLVPGEHVHGVAGDGVDDAVRVGGPLLELLVGLRGPHLEHPLVLGGVEGRRRTWGSHELLALLRDCDRHYRLDFGSVPVDISAR